MRFPSRKEKDNEDVEDPVSAFLRACSNLANAVLCHIVGIGVEEEECHKSKEAKK